MYRTKPAKNAFYIEAFVTIQAFGENFRLCNVNCEQYCEVTCQTAAP